MNPAIDNSRLKNSIHVISPILAFILHYHAEIFADYNFCFQLHLLVEMSSKTLIFFQSRVALHFHHDLQVSDFQNPTIKSGFASYY
jgi:hypothetical protein